MMFMIQYVMSEKFQLIKDNRVSACLSQKEIQMGSKAVITVVGKDAVGIINRISGVLVKYDVNILDINQAVVGEFFTMILVADISGIGERFDDLRNDLETVGKEINQQITMQHEDIFNAMHTV